MNSVAPISLASNDFLASLTPDELDALTWDHSTWLRPSQRIELGGWRSTGYIAGRGNGKTFAIACELNRHVDEGTLRAIGLMGPTEKRTHEVIVQNLIATAPPWNVPEVYKDLLVWPNGARAELFTAEAPDAPRGSNLDACWLTELVAWPANTRDEAYDDITTATRVGKAIVLWDTTSRGQNGLILRLLGFHEEAPEVHRVIRGSIFDNPFHSRGYLREECRKYPPGSRAEQEELWGRVFAEAAGASYMQAWLDDNRRDSIPADVTHRIVSVDPNKSTQSKRNDECGIVCGGVSDSTGHVYVYADRSAQHELNTWGDLVVRECLERGAAGVIVERQGVDDYAFNLIQSRARELGAQCVRVKRDDRIPRRQKGVIFIKDVNTHVTKASRQDGPASETELGRVHLVGSFPLLENQLTTYDGTGRSPNRFDAYGQLVTELSGLGSVVPVDTSAQVREAASALEHLRALRTRRGAGRSL